MRRGPAAILTAALLALLAATGARAEEVRVAGNRHVDADTIRSYFLGQSAEALDAGVKKLYATGLFADVRITQQGGAVLVTVEENPLIARVAFEGNSKVKDEDLLKAVESKARGAFIKARVQGDVARIVELYHQRGRYDVRVDPKTIEVSDRRVNLVFEIKEGARTGIRQIRFVGNSAYSATQLKGVVKTGQTNFLSVLLNNDFYDADKLEGDRELLRRFYAARGYADVRVEAASTEYDPELKGFVVTFRIEEGTRYRLGQVDVASDVESVDASALRRSLATQSNDTYNADAIEKSVASLGAKIAGNGEPFADVQVRTERAGDTINLRYLVAKGPRVYVERIEIHGNGKTRDYVIRREFDFAEGDPYNGALVTRAERRLKNLGFFKTVAITRRAGSTADRVIVDVALEEQDTGNFQVSGGYSSQDGAIAEVSVTERNLFGRGEQVKAAVSYGQYSKGFALGFVEPYAIGRASLGGEVFGRQVQSSDFQSYESVTYGGKITMGAPLSDELGMQLNYSLYRQSITLDPTRGIASLPIQEAAAAGPTWVSSIGTSATYSTVDNARNPTSGFRATFNEEVAGLGGDVKFIKSTDDVRYYQPIADGVTGMLRAQSGYVTPWGGQPLPLMNGFFGGPSLVRGFATNGFGPRDLTPGTTMDNVGGNIYWATSAELMSAIPFIPPDAGLKVATFADAGSLWRTGSAGATPGLSQSFTANSRSIRSSLGVGLVWDSILGPIRVDYAYPTTHTSYDVTQRFRFSAGGF